MVAVSEHFNIILEYGIRKTFTDYLDDKYNLCWRKSKFNKSISYWHEFEAQEMSDLVPASEKHTLGEERGDPNKNDWYSFAELLYPLKYLRPQLVVIIILYHVT